jgi:hypothetical protein
MIKILLVGFFMLLALSLGYEYFHQDHYTCTGTRATEFASPEENTQFTEHLLINAASQNETYDVAMIKKTRAVKFEFSQDFKHRYEISAPSSLAHFINPEIKLKTDTPTKSTYDLDRLGKVEATAQIDKTKISIVFNKLNPQIEMHYFYTMLNLKSNKPETVQNEDVYATCSKL